MLMHQGMIRDYQCITVDQRVGQLLETMIEVIGRHLALSEIVQFTLKMHGVTRLVAIKQVVKVYLDHTGSRATKLHTHIHQVLKDSGVDPITNKKIFDGPLNVGDRNAIIFHMMKEIKPPKDHGEEGPPLGVVVRLKIQHVWQRDLVATL
jgi:hypothetical protein